MKRLSALGSERIDCLSFSRDELMENDQLINKPSFQRLPFSSPRLRPGRKAQMRLCVCVCACVWLGDGGLGVGGQGYWSQSTQQPPPRSHEHSPPLGCPFLASSRVAECAWIPDAVPAELSCPLGLLAHYRSQAWCLHLAAETFSVVPRPPPPIKQPARNFELGDRLADSKDIYTFPPSSSTET